MELIAFPELILVFASIVGSDKLQINSKAFILEPLNFFSCSLKLVDSIVLVQKLVYLIYLILIRIWEGEALIFA